MNNKDILSNVFAVLRDGSKIPDTNIFGNVTLFSNSEISYSVRSTASKLNTIKEFAEAEFEKTNSPKESLELAYILDIIDFITQYTINIFDHIDKQKPVLLGGVRRYLGKSDISEKFYNQMFRDYGEMLDRHRINLVKVHTLTRILNNNPANKEAVANELVKLLPDGPASQPAHLSPMHFPRTRIHCAHLKAGNEPAEKAAVTDTLAKSDENIGMDFVSLHKHYTEFYASLGKQDDPTVNNISAILSSPELRKMFGLDATRYNPVTLLHKVQETMSSPGFDTINYQIELVDALENGIRRLDRYNEQEAASTHNDDNKNDAGIRLRS